MKKFIVFALVLIDLGLFAQDTSYLNQKPKTQIQKFDLKLGSILKRQYFDVYQSGWLGDRKLNFRLLNIRDAGTGESLWGLIVNIEFSSSRYSSNYSVYIDEDELPSIEKFIDFLAKNDSIVINTYTEYIYNFKEFQIYAYNNKNYKKRDKSIVKVSKSEGADAKSDPKSGKNIPKKKSESTVVTSDELLAGVEETNTTVAWVYGIRVDRYSDRGVAFIGLSQLIEFKTALQEKMKMIHKE